MRQNSLSLSRRNNFCVSLSEIWMRERKKNSKRTQRKGREGKLTFVKNKIKKFAKMKQLIYTHTRLFKLILFCYWKNNTHTDLILKIAVIFFDKIESRAMGPAFLDKYIFLLYVKCKWVLKKAKHALENTWRKKKCPTYLTLNRVSLNISQRKRAYNCVLFFSKKSARLFPKTTLKSQ